MRQTPVLSLCLLLLTCLHGITAFNLPVNSFRIGSSIASCRMQTEYNRMVPPPPPPRRPGGPPPPPSRQAPKETVEREAGGWREAVLGNKVSWPRPAGSDDDVPRIVRLRKTPDMLREDRLRREKAEAKKNDPPPPPMLSSKEWEVSLRISGAKTFQDLYDQLEYAKQGNFVELERKWLKDGASKAEIKKRLGQAVQVRNEAKAFPLGERPWANEGSKSPRPSKGEFFRYMHKQEKFDGKVLPMSAPKRNSISEEQFLPKKLFTQPLLESSRSSNSNRQLPPSRRPDSRGEGRTEGRREGRGEEGRGGGREEQGRQGRRFWD